MIETFSKTFSTLAETTREVTISTMQRTFDKNSAESSSSYEGNEYLITNDIKVNTPCGNIIGSGPNNILGK